MTSNLTMSPETVAWLEASKAETRRLQQQEREANAKWWARHERTRGVWESIEPSQVRKGDWIAYTLPDRLKYGLGARLEGLAVEDGCGSIQISRTEIGGGHPDAPLECLADREPTDLLDVLNTKQGAAA